MMEKSKIFRSTRGAVVVCAQAALLVSGGLKAQASDHTAAPTAPSSTSIIADTGGTAATVAPSASAAANADDDRAIRQQAGDYAKAFAAGDAKALAQMWTESGSFVDSHGQMHQGRDAIEAFFRDGFREGHPQTLDIVIDSIKYPAPGVAVEEGTTRIASGPGMGSMGRYLVVHSKAAGKWLMSTCEETDCRASSHSEYLKELEWLVGSWSVKGQPKAAQLKVNWSKNKTFLICRYVKADGKNQEVEELQIIGWDPHAARIVVWHFGPDGGFGSGKMVFDGKQWIEHASATEPDGSLGKAHYKMTRLDDSSFTWQSSNRTLEGRALPDASPLTIVRDHIQ